MFDTRFMETFLSQMFCEEYWIGRHCYLCPKGLPCLYCWLCHIFCRNRGRGGGEGHEVKERDAASRRLLKFWCSVHAMDHLEFCEEYPWFSYLGLSNDSDSGQILSTVATCPATVLSNISPLDTEMYNGLDTSSMYGQNHDAPCPTGGNFMPRTEHPECLTSDDNTFWADMDIESLLMECEDPEDNHLIPDAHHSTYATIENPDIFNDEGSIVFTPETNFVPPAVSRSASVRCRWPNFVWLICACNRFSYAAAASLRAKVPQASIVLKGVMKKKDKYVCETRVARRKIQREKNNLIKKVWLGTYQTQAQAARALDVGKYFLNDKETKSFSDPNSETILSKLSYLLAQPLEELVENVKMLAKHYGHNGSLPQNFIL